MKKLAKFMLCFLLVGVCSVEIHGLLRRVGRGGPPPEDKNKKTEPKNYQKSTQKCSWNLVKFDFPHEGMKVVEQTKDRLFAEGHSPESTLEIFRVEELTPENIAHQLLQEVEEEHGEVTIEFQKEVILAKCTEGYEIHGSFHTEDGDKSFWILGTNSEAFAGQKKFTECCAVKMVVDLDDEHDDDWERGCADSILETEYCKDDKDE